MAVSFPQNGTVDWTSLTSMTVSVPITLLSRLSQAGVDTYTLELTKFYGQFLNIPTDYLETVEKGLLQAKKFGLSAHVLFVGTGISIVPSELAKTRGGVAFATITMTLRAAFGGNFTAKVLSEWLSFFERPAELSLPSLNQLEALSNEVASCPIDPEIGHVIWMLERLYDQSSGSKVLINQGRKIIAPPHANDLAMAIHTITTIRPGENIVMRFKSAFAPSPTWLAAFASKVVGLRVSFEMGNQVIWEQQGNHRFGEGHRGHLRLVIAGPSNDPKNNMQMELLKSVEITLQRQEIDIETSFRISPERVVAGFFESLSFDDEQRILMMECICKAAHHLSQKPSRNRIQGFKYDGIIDSSRTKSALEEFGIDPQSIDLWIEEAKAGAINRIIRTITKDKYLQPDLWSYEEDLEEFFGRPFVHAFKRLHDAAQKPFSTIPKPWTKTCLGTLKKILLLWSLFTFTTRAFPEKDVITMDGRTIARLERSENIFFKLEELWTVLYFTQDSTGRLERYEPAFINNAVSKKIKKGEVVRVYREHHLRIDMVHRLTFDLIGGGMGLSYSSNDRSVGVARGGTFVIMKTLLEPNPPGLKESMTIFVGQGSIFINERATSYLSSFSSGYDTGKDFTIPPEIKSFSQASLYDHMDVLGDLTQILITMSPYVSERPGSSAVAWSVNARHGADVLFDLLLSPHQILEEFWYANCVDLDVSTNTVLEREEQAFIQKGISEKVASDDIFVTNVEQFCSGTLQGQAQLIMAKDNYPAQLVALHYAFSKDISVYICPLEQLEFVSPRTSEKVYILVN